jgi:hypothetical protein
VVFLSAMWVRERRAVATAVTTPEPASRP